MSVSERCSCGASFKTDEVDAMKHVRAWRREHRCLDGEAEIQAIGGGSAQVEHALGFSIQNLDVPARSTDPWEDE